ncbi:hypothetical protein LCGC14_1984270 [marine sediment metagenome]|uniref:Uncharacterized protein n=1 Tax=marine sediment metagenome TaxID=412755 RepID=A0A0F9I519_9ZZZZ
MKLKFRIHEIPAHSGHYKEHDKDNILLVDVHGGDLWFLWDKTALKHENVLGHHEFKLKKIR